MARDSPNRQWLFNLIIAPVAVAAIAGAFIAVRDFGRVEERLDNQVRIMIRFQQQYADDFTRQASWARRVDQDLASLKEYRRQQRDNDYRK